MKTWNKGDEIANELIDLDKGKYSIEAFESHDKPNQITYNRPIKNLYDNQVGFDESLKTLNRLTNDTTGIFDKALDGFALDENLYTFDNKFYIYLKSGIAKINNEVIYYNYDTRLAERKLIEINQIEEYAEIESIKISIDETNLYDLSIKYIDTNNTLVTETITNKKNSIEILNSLNSLNGIAYTGISDPKMLGLDECLVMVDDSDNYVYIDTDKKIKSDVTLPADVVALYKVVMVSGAIDSTEDLREYVKSFNEINNLMFFNVPSSWDSTKLSERTVSELLDTTDADWTDSDIDANGITGFVFLKTSDGTADEDEENGMFVFVKKASEGMSEFKDESNSDIENAFVLNKDLYVKKAAGLKYKSLRNAIDSFESGINTVDNYGELPSSPEADVYFVEGENQFYRYNTLTSSWILIDNPRSEYRYKSYLLNSYSDSDNGSGIKDNKTFTIPEITNFSWNINGSDLEVFVNGLLQTFSTEQESTGDYTLTGTKIITFEEEVGFSFNYNEEGTGQYVILSQQNLNNQVSDPAGVENDVYYNTSNDNIYFYDGASWIEITTSELELFTFDDEIYVDKDIVNILDETETYSFEESTIMLKLYRGGENYYPERKVVDVETTAVYYHREVPGFHIVRDKIDVFLDGALQREGIFKLRGVSEEDTNPLITRVVFDGQGTSISETLGLSGPTSYTSSAGANGWGYEYDVSGMDLVVHVERKGPTDTYSGEARTSIISKIIESYADTSATGIGTQTAFIIAGGDYDNDGAVNEHTITDIIDAGATIDIFETKDYIINETNDIVIFTKPIANGNVVDIRDRTSIVSNKNFIYAGEIFPIDGGRLIFGIEFYRTDLQAWFKWNGQCWTEK